MASPDAAAPVVGRRQALLLLVGMPLAVGGCTVSDPRIDRRGPVPPGSSSAGATPSVAPTSIGDPAAVALEQGLADLAWTIWADPRFAKAPTAQRTLLVAVRQAHLQHAAVLASPGPTAAPTPVAPPTAVRDPAVRGLDLTRALARLAAAETAAAALHRTAALAASGTVALIRGSTAVAATSYAAVLRSGGTTAVTSVFVGRPLPQLTDTAAIQDVVAQLHALVYGYQLSLGLLPVTGAKHARAIAELLATRLLRDRLAAALARRGAEVPVAEPAYVPPVQVTNEKSAATAIRLMRTALLPHLGLYLLTAPTLTDRTLALATLTSATATARSWGAPAAVWPGWPV